MQRTFCDECDKQIEAKDSDHIQTFVRANPIIRVSVQFDSIVEGTQRRLQLCKQCKLKLIADLVAKIDGAPPEQ
jgi:hypothetical protein